MRVTSCLKTWDGLESFWGDGFSGKVLEWGAQMGWKVYRVSLFSWLIGIKLT